MRLGAVKFAWASKDLIELYLFLQATLNLVRSNRLSVRHPVKFQYVT